MLRIDRLTGDERQLIVTALLLQGLSDIIFDDTSPDELVLEAEHQQKEKLLEWDELKAKVDIQDLASKLI